MAELISKQAAIYAIKVHAESIGTDIKAYQLAHRHLAEVIEILPAVQQEPCEDAVSRAEIIRLILERGLYCDTQADRETSAEIIRQLPAAEPERILCRDCKRYNSHDHRCTVWNHGIHTDDWCSRAERRIDE